MRAKKLYIIHKLLLVAIVLFCFESKAQKTIAFDIATSTDSKQILLFNTSLHLDSAPIYTTKKRKLSVDEAYASEYYHNEIQFFQLFEADGSALLIDTGGYLYLQDNENIEAKPKPLYINIDTLGLGRKNLIIETSSKDLENLKLFVIPYAKYTFKGGEPNVKSQLSLRLEEIIYGAKNKVPPRLLDLWNEQVKFIPENRKILYNFSIILPPSMVYRKGEKTLMVYDLANQVVAIFPNLDKDVNVLRRENIMTKTYIYKLYFNEEEVKKGFLHFLSPEDEQKKKEAENAPPAKEGDTPEEDGD